MRQRIPAVHVYNPSVFKPLACDRDCSMSCKNRLGKCAAMNVACLARMDLASVVANLRVCFR